MTRWTLKSWLQLPRWGALILGFGALCAGGARASDTELQSVGSTPRPSKEHGATIDEVVIRTDGEKIYLSHGGSAFEEISLGNTAEAAYLKALLDETGAIGESVTVPVGSIIVANGVGRQHGTKPKQPNERKLEPGQPDTKPGRKGKVA